jgi:uroporphyrin-III C-methyltransferase
MPSNTTNHPLTGRISLVGAGPGDPDLITVKGRNALAGCDCLLYDLLVDERMLEWVKPECELICVGKRPGMHSMPQETINKVLIEHARKGKWVVRLKGGDPFIFGRGGEEIQAIKAFGIPFEVIPGVTSAVAAAASLQKPLTHREKASSLIFVTGHEDPQKHQPRIDWSEVVVSNSTVVIYMGMKHLPEIVASLVKAGKPSQTPCAIVQWVSTPKQKSLETSLEDLCARVTAEGIGSPAIVIIGDVLSESF